MENDWRHSQCSKVELNLRVTGKPEVNFSIADHLGVIVSWLESKCQVRPPRRAVE
jgi:hypothetical protein